MLTHDSFNQFSGLVELEPTYRSKSNLNKKLFSQRETGYSSHSIIQNMETFVEAVQEMDETILVPSRLIDVQMDPVESKSHSPAIPPLLSGIPDLYTLYNTVRNVKSQLQWGSRDVDDDSHSSSSSTSGYLSTAGLLSSAMAKGHARRPSTASMSSTNSSAASVISDPDSEVSTENDSGIDAELECSKINPLDIIEQTFQMHLRGLSDSLKELTDAARYVTKRYQKDVGGQ